MSQLAGAAIAAPPTPLRSAAALLPTITFLPQLRRRTNLPLTPTCPVRPLRLNLSAAGHQGAHDHAHAAPSASSMEVDMVRGRDGVWSPVSEEREKRVVVLWDLDNKPPRGPPYEAAMALRRVAALFGQVVDVSAYANRHAFLHLPQWVLDRRRERRHLDDLERRALSAPPPDDPYLCGVCGRKCRTHADLRKHFRQLHERERQKKLSRMRSLRGKRRRSYRERYISGNTKYEEAARELLTPRVGYGLASELRRAGVFVKTVADKPQAADAALKRQVQHSMARGIHWLFLVSDDSDFGEMLRRARESDLRTVVVGDGRTALSREADMWFPWMGVESGQVGDEVLKRSRQLDGDETEVSVSGSCSDWESDWSELDGVVDDIVIGSSGFGRARMSAFSEEEVVGLEDVGDEERLDDHGDFHRSRLALPGEDLLWDSDDEDDGYS